MAEQAARRRHEDDLAAPALLQHLRAGRARHQPRLRDIGVHHVEEVSGFWSTILATLLRPDAVDEDVDPTERLDCGIDDRVAVLLRSSAAC